VTNGVWLASASVNPSNPFALYSTTPIYLDQSNLLVRDPYVCSWVSNGVPLFVMTYTALYPNGNTPGPGVALSRDGTNFIRVGYASLPNGRPTSDDWSPKISINSTNGLLGTVGLSTNGYMLCFIYDVNVTNLTAWSNPRPITVVSNYMGESSAGMIICTNGLNYYFSSDGEEFTNAGTATAGWGALNYSIPQGGNWFQPGPSVFYSNGTWYWFVSAYSEQLITSVNLVNWVPNVFTNSAISANPVFLPFGPNEGAYLPSTGLIQRF
jgi:hypothetical protein